MPTDYAHYLPPGNSPSIWGADILGAGFASIRPGQPYPPKGHPPDHYFEWEHGRALSEFQLLFISHGAGALETAHATGESLRLAAPTLFLLFPGVWHRYRPDRETGWREHWVSFDGPAPRALWEAGEIGPDRPIHAVGHSERLLAQLELIHDEARAEALGFRSVAATAIMQILALAISLPERNLEETQPLRGIVRQACFLLRDRSDRTVSPAALAEELGVGYSYFRRLFKRYTGMSAKRYHAQLRLERCKRLLQRTAQSVGEIADALGFDSPFHLSHWFKAETGASPREWRASARN